jgi:hypothetical protein
MNGNSLNSRAGLTLILSLLGHVQLLLTQLISEDHVLVSVLHLQVVQVVLER